MVLQEEDDHNAKKVIFVGLDNAGKTSIIFLLLREISKFAVIKPTRNAERRTFEFLGMNISEWDLGGHERYRKLYLEKAQIIFRRTDIVIYIVDVQDHDRIVESYLYLSDIIKNLIEMKIEPPIHIFFHKDDPGLAEREKTKKNDTVTYLKSKIRDIQKYKNFSFYETSVFEISSIVNPMSEILLSLFPRSKVIDNSIQGFAEKSGVEGVEIIDDNSLIIGSWYKNNGIKEILNPLSPYFLRLNDGFEKIEIFEDQSENHMIVERFGKCFIFKQFMLKEIATPYYILICTNEPFLKKSEFNAFTSILREIISKEI
ncbi:MAG: ADP-ribosylation factor-like protein [Promethearchaeota archaeon]|jgi:small GTP-binding protein